MSVAAAWVVRHRAHLAARAAKPAKFNDRVALVLTKLVGSMWCAYAFACLALISLPDAIKAGRSTIVSWVAQTFLQLVLLSIIMVGTNLLGITAEARDRETHDDVVALYTSLHAKVDAIHEAVVDK